MTTEFMQYKKLNIPLPKDPKLGMDRERDKGAAPKNAPKKEIPTVMDPAGRLKYLTDCRSAIEINPNYAPKMYYRSGIEMNRMASSYMKEGNYEYAYALYMKFLTLSAISVTPLFVNLILLHRRDACENPLISLVFDEKITEHPQFNTVPAVDKAKNKEMLKQIIPIAEELKKKLLEQYKVEAVAAEKLRIQQERAAEEARKKLQSRERDETLNLPSAPPSTDFDHYTDNTTSFPKSDDPSVPTFDRSLKPSFPTHKFGLREIVVPSKVMSEFLKLANPNTLSNKETCGILAGSVERNQLFISHLLIPQQMGSPDSCVTHNEEDIFDYQDQHSLITLGWIHTHPTQTAFLSSVDLHTHCAYQLMMAEAIAIVCAPKYEETGFFMLTPEHGLNFIAKCRATGFHPHPDEKSLYTHADHCKLDTSAAVRVVDLRKTK